MFMFCNLLSLQFQKPHTSCLEASERFLEEAASACSSGACLPFATKLLCLHRYFNRFSRGAKNLPPTPWNLLLSTPALPGLPKIDQYLTRERQQVGASTLRPHQKLYERGVKRATHGPGKFEAMVVHPGRSGPPFAPSAPPPLLAPGRPGPPPGHELASPSHPAAFTAEQTRKV